MKSLPAGRSLQWKWVIIGVLVMTGIYLVSRLFLPFAFLAWVAFCVAYLIGGGLIGYYSPGLTLWEPAVAALISVALVNLYPFPAGLGLLLLILKLVLAFGLALTGGFFGEKLQWEK